MTTENYITPTKERPVFQATNTYEGYILNDFQTYKDWSIVNMVGETTATTLPGAMQALFTHIQSKSWMMKATFVIEMIDGSVDKYGDPIRAKVYQISMRQAKKFGLIK